MRHQIRWMVRRDMPDVLAIETDSFEFPWPEEDFIRVLRQRNCIGFVAERSDGRVLGFMIFELHRTRIQLLNLAVTAECHRQGIGRALMRNLATRLSPERRTSIRLEVRDSNLDGQMFFRACGFKATRIVRDFYDDTDDDAYVFEYRIPQEDRAQAIVDHYKERG